MKYLIPSLLLSSAVFAAHSPRPAQACTGEAFLNWSQSTGVRFLSLADGDTDVPTSAKILIATNQEDTVVASKPPLFSLVDVDGTSVPLRQQILATTNIASPRKVTVFALTPETGLVAGRQYRMTASIGTPETITFTAAEAVSAEAPKVELQSLNITSSQHSASPFGTCLSPPFFHAAYEWQASRAAVLAFRIRGSGNVEELIGAWHGSGKDQVQIDAGSGTSSDHTRQGCVILKAYDSQLRVTSSEKLCQPLFPRESPGDAGTADAGSNDAGVSLDAPTVDTVVQPGSGGCSVGTGGTSGAGLAWVLELLGAVWLRGKLRKKRPML